MRHETSPDVSPAELSELVAGNNAFAFDLYHAVREEHVNLVFSPFSVSLALVMTYAGARGETEQQIQDTLHFTLPPDRLHPTFNALDLALTSPGETTGRDGEQEFILNIANAIWGQRDYPFLSEYLDILALNYGAGLRLADFKSAPEDARVTINGWLSDETESRIEDLIPRGALDQDTRLVLVNAVYFYGAWRHPFFGLHKDTFFLLDGTQTAALMMEQKEMLRYTAGDGYQAVELPYQGDEAAMIILLPDRDRFAEFEGMLDVGQFGAVLGNLERSELYLTMPLVEYEVSFGLRDTLADMGMPLSFDRDLADFSGMADLSTSGNLYIDDVLHKTYISVDQYGTEAAAVAEAEVIEEEAPELYVEINRPFIFAIYDIESGVILFLGRVLNPVAG